MCFSERMAQSRLWISKVTIFICVFFGKILCLSETQSTQMWKGVNQNYLEQLSRELEAMDVKALWKL